MAYIAGSLKANSHEVIKLDFVKNPKNLENRLEKALREKPDLIGIYITSMPISINHAVNIAIKAKKIYKPKLLIAGGPHLSLLGMEFMQENNVFDIGVVGEGEKTIIDLCDAVDGKKTLEDVPGIIFRQGRNVMENPKRAPVEDLDSLPFPDYSDCFSSAHNTAYDCYPLVTSRGCPYNCTFCAVRIYMGKKWRARNIDEVIKELEYAKKELNITRFRVWDDNFTQDIERAKAFCDLLNKHKINLSWSAPCIRADKADYELFVKMKDSGCQAIGFGIESGDPHVLKKVCKGETIEDIEKAVNLAHRVGFYTYASFIIGLPGSTFESEMKSLKFAKRLKLHYVDFSLLWPVPKTPVRVWIAKNGRYINEAPEGIRFGIINKRAYFETPDFTRTQRFKAFFICHVKMLNFHLILDPETRGIMKKIHILHLLWKYDRPNIIKSSLLYGKYFLLRINKRIDEMFGKIGVF